MSSPSLDGWSRTVATLWQPLSAAVPSGVFAVGLQFCQGMENDLPGKTRVSVGALVKTPRRKAVRARIASVRGLEMIFAALARTSRYQQRSDEVSTFS